MSSLDRGCRAAACLALLIATGSARADTAKIDAQQLHAPATSTGYIGLDSPEVLGHLRGAAGLVLSYGHDALQLRDVNGNVVAGGTIVASQIWLEALGSVGLLDRLELGVALPIALSQGGDDSPGLGDPGAALRGERGIGLGDLRLDLKILLVDHAFGGARRTGSEDRAHHLRLALVAGATFPTSTTALSGEDNVTGRPRLALEWAYRRLRVTANVGAIFRARAEVLGLDVTHQLTWGLGARVAVWRELELLVEGRGAVGVAPPRGAFIDSVEVPAEVDAAIAYTTRFGLRIFGGGGVGLGRGYGVPDGRFVAGLRFVTPERKPELPWTERDDDHDGVVNALDRCLNAPGPAINEGCPEADYDGDGVSDRLDKCPERMGIPENAGCPDYDTDGDNIPDRLDACPKEAGPAGSNGCPPKDSDGDGVPDASDRCPEQAGTAQNAGCPDVDSDGDGVADRVDKCPFDPEVYNGVADEDGCPDAGPALAGLAPGQIAIFEPLQFEKDVAGEKLAAHSRKVLAAIGALLRVHTEVKRVRVDAHIDDHGDPVDNLDLSAARAQLVRRVLIEEQRIDPKRVTAQGYGGTRPLGENTTAQGRARNRRIEITILEEAK